MQPSSNFLGGNYTQEELNRIFEIGRRPESALKPFNAFYKKSSGEHGPTWAERKEVIIIDNQ